jgi:two-component system response regulator
MRLVEAQLLVVEDNPSDAELIRESLGSQAAPLAHVVNDGVEALDFIFCRGAFIGRTFDQPPRLILLDIKLPKVDGFEVLRQLKHDERTRLIPVVMLTSSKIEQDVARAYALGANSYIQKPMEFSQFRATVHTVGEYGLALNERPPASPPPPRD